MKNFLMLEFLRHSLFMGGSTLLFGKNHIEENKLKFYLTSLLIGSDLLAYFIAYPLDTINKRLILQDTRADKVYLDAKDCLKKMIKQEKMRSLWRGFIFGAAARLIEPKNLVFILEIIEKDH